MLYKHRIFLCPCTTIIYENGIRDKIFAIFSLHKLIVALISFEQMRVFLFGKKGSEAFLTALACNEYNFRAIFDRL